MRRFYFSFASILPTVFMNLDGGGPAGGGGGVTPGSASAGVAPGVSGGGGGSSSPAPAANPSPTSTPSAPTAPTPSPAGSSSAPASPGFAANNSPATNPAGSAASSNPGMSAPAPTVNPEMAALQQQVTQFQQQFQQMQPLLQMGWQAWQQSRNPGAANPPAGAQAPAQKPWNNPFGLPQLDRQMFSFVQRDPNTQQLVPTMGAPPDAVQRVQEYMDKLSDTQHKFWQDPTQFLQPMIEERARAVAQEIVQQQFGQQQQTQAIQNIVQQNSDWLYEKDASGAIKSNYNFITGQRTPAYTPAGQFYVGQVEQAKRFGITDPTAQHQFAVANLQSAVAQQRLQQLQAPAAGQQAAQQFLQGAAAGHQQHQPQPGGFNPPAAVPNQPLPTAQSLEEMMRLQFQQEGLLNPGVLEAQLTRGQVA